MRHVVYRGNTFEIYKIKKDNNSEKWIEYCRRGSSVVVLGMTDNGQFVLLKEKRKEHKSFTWGLVSGHIEKGEIRNPIRAARRELLEEAGFRAKNIRLLYISEPSSSVKWKRYVYLASGLTKQKNNHMQDEDERIKVKCVSAEQAFGLCLSGEIKNETASLAIIRYLIQNNWVNWSKAQTKDHH